VIAPVADPSGDYAIAMFDLMNAAHPGAGKTLRANAERQWAIPSPAVTAGQSTTAALFQARWIDVAVTYCSTSADLAKSTVDLESIAVPAAFDPKPVFGLALLSNNPAAARFALLLLSQTGQSAIAAAGLIPVSDVPSR
jgi:molybdate transport system substrate-binding protein